MDLTFHADYLAGVGVERELAKSNVHSPLYRNSRNSDNLPKSPPTDFSNITRRDRPLFRVEGPRGDAEKRAVAVCADDEADDRIARGATSARTAGPLRRNEKAAHAASEPRPVSMSGWPFLLADLPGRTFLAAQSSTLLTGIGTLQTRSSVGIRRGRSERLPREHAGCGIVTPSGPR